MMSVMRVQDDGIVRTRSNRVGPFLITRKRCPAPPFSPFNDAPWHINRPQDDYFATFLIRTSTLPAQVDRKICLYPSVHDGDSPTPLRDLKTLMLTFCGHILFLEPHQSYQRKWSPIIVRLLRRSCADAVVRHVMLRHLPKMASLN